MTWATLMTWIPREATSVATRTLNLPWSKPFRAPVRCDWVRSPWIIAAENPSRTRFLARRSVPRLANGDLKPPHGSSASQGMGSLNRSYELQRLCGSQEHKGSPRWGHGLYLEFEDGLYNSGLLAFRDAGIKR